MTGQDVAAAIRANPPAWRVGAEVLVVTPAGVRVRGEVVSAVWRGDGSGWDYDVSVSGGYVTVPPEALSVAPPLPVPRRRTRRREDVSW